MDKFDWEHTSSGKIVIIDQKGSPHFIMLTFRDAEQANSFVRELNELIR